MPNYKLSYFDVRGLAEIVRLIMAYTGQEYSDIRLTMEEWSKFKPSTPFGQMPVLHIDDKLYGQSGAIANYLASENNLYGKTNLEALEIDQVVCLIGDLRTATVKAIMEKDETKKAEEMKRFSEFELPKYLGFLDGLLSKNGSGFFVGTGITLADISAYDLLWGLNEIMPGCLNNFPQVKAHLEKVESVPNIKAYVDARKPTPY